MLFNYITPGLIKVLGLRKPVEYKRGEKDVSEQEGNGAGMAMRDCGNDGALSDN